MNTSLRFLFSIAVICISSSSWLNGRIKTFPLVADAQAACISSINQVVLAEAMVTNTTFVRTYVMCPNMMYAIGKLDFYDKMIEGGQAMFPLRPNINIKCGYGRRDANCLITSGDVFVDGTSYWDIPNESIDGAVIEGFTFVQPGKLAVELTKPGKVTFRDCIFKDAVNATAAVLADFYDPSDNSQNLEVTFHRCDFVNNRYNWRGGQASLVVGNSLQNRLIFQECRFSGNDMTFNNSNVDTNSYLVESSGPLEMVNNCFDSNKVGVATLAIYSTYLTSKNYGNGTAGVKCPFGAEFTDPTRYEMFAPECHPYDADSCDISATFAPIGEPTATPSFMPTKAPVTNQPTADTPAPSAAPSVEPTTAAPSSEPSMVPTTDSPSIAKSAAEVVDFVGTTGRISFGLLAVVLSMFFL